MIIPIIAVNIFLLLQIIFYLHIRNVGRLLSRWLITGCFLIFLFSMFEGIYLLTDFYKTHPAFAFFSGPMILLLGPGLYYFTKSVLDQQFSFKYIHLLHLMPFLIVLISIQIFYQPLSTEEQVSILYKSIETDSPPFFVYVSTLIFFSIAAAYMWEAQRIVSVYQNRLKQQFANFNTADARWLRYTIYSFLWILFFSFLQNLVRLYSSELWHLAVLINLGLFIFLGSKIFFNFIEHKSLILPQYQYEDQEDLMVLEEIARQAEHTTRTQKLFLKADISLPLLAAKLKVRPAQLSLALNQIIGKNFFDFINEKRVQEAKNKLLNFSPKEKNVTEIMYECGFNSKSSFNTAFKKHSGQTPSEFRRLKG